MATTRKMTTALADKTNLAAAAPPPPHVTLKRGSNSSLPAPQKKGVALGAVTRKVAAPIQRQGTYRGPNNSQVKVAKPSLPPKPKRPLTRNNSTLLPKRSKTSHPHNLNKSENGKNDADVSTGEALVAELASRSTAELILVLPPGVEDADRNDDGDPQLCADLVVDIYRYLRRLEVKLSIPGSFLKGSCITPRMRSVLIDWLMEVHGQFLLLQETLYMTVAIIDRFLALQGFTVKRKQLQLVGVSAMFLASKFEEMFCPEIDDFVYITDNTYSKAEIRDMEKLILRTLDFQLGRPLPIHFLRRCSKVGKVNLTQHVMAKFFLESVLVEVDFVPEAPSALGAASLLLAVKVTDPTLTWDACWTPTQEFYSGYAFGDMKRLLKKLAAVVVKIHDSPYKAAREKFAVSKNLKVSKSPLLKGPTLQAIAEGHFET